MRKSSALSVVVLVSLLVLTACAKRPVPPMETPMGSLAVAAFTQPSYDWQLLAGFIPEGGDVPSKEALMQLDSIVDETLFAHGYKNYTPAAATSKCQEIELFQQKDGSRSSAWKYWVSVGQCMDVDYLLVPQLLFWKERQGDNMGAKSPASVVIDLYLIDVRNEGLVRKHYDETQLALSENLLEADKFFDRGWKWVPASELAREGLNEMLLELGL